MSATWFDGKSAARRAATVSLVADALVIFPEGQAPLRWPLDCLRWVNRPDSAGEARLACGDDAARLDIVDPVLVSALRRAWPAIDRAAIRHERHGRTAVIALGGVAAIGAAIYAAAAFLPALLAPLVPPEVERSIGEAAVRQIVGIFGTLEKREARLCDGAAGQAAIDRLVARLVPDDEPAGRIAVTVANIGMVNALAAPGGRLLMFRGLIDFAKIPEEFAGVLAHEMGHALHRHPTKGMIREIGLSSTLGILTGSAGAQGLAGTAANVAVRTTYTREAEEEADDTAVRLLQRAGIGTAGMISLFDRFARMGTDLPKSVQLFSTHPRSEDRARHIRALGGASAGPAMSAADWAAIRAMCGEKG